MALVIEEENALGPPRDDAIQACQQVTQSAADAQMANSGAKAIVEYMRGGLDQQLTLAQNCTKPKTAEGLDTLYVAMELARTTAEECKDAQDAKLARALYGALKGKVQQLSAQAGGPEAANAAAAQSVVAALRAIVNQKNSAIALVERARAAQNSAAQALVTRGTARARFEALRASYGTAFNKKKSNLPNPLPAGLADESARATERHRAISAVPDCNANFPPAGDLAQQAESIAGEAAGAMAACNGSGAPDKSADFIQLAGARDADIAAKVQACESRFANSSQQIQSATSSTGYGSFRADPSNPATDQIVNTQGRSDSSGNSGGVSLLGTSQTPSAVFTESGPGTDSPTISAGAGFGAVDWGAGSAQRNNVDNFLDSQQQMAQQQQLAEQRRMAVQQEQYAQQQAALQPLVQQQQMAQQMALQQQAAQPQQPSRMAAILGALNQTLAQAAQAKGQSGAGGQALRPEDVMATFNQNLAQMAQGQAGSPQGQSQADAMAALTRSIAQMSQAINQSNPGSTMQMPLTSQLPQFPTLPQTQQNPQTSNIPQTPYNPYNPQPQAVQNQTQYPVQPQTQTQPGINKPATPAINPLKPAPSGTWRNCEDTYCPNCGSSSQVLLLAQDSAIWCKRCKLRMAPQIAACQGSPAPTTVWSSGGKDYCVYWTPEAHAAFNSRSNYSGPAYEIISCDQPYRGGSSDLSYGPETLANCQAWVNGKRK
jgi:hypothetical protein